MFHAPIHFRKFGVVYKIVISYLTKFVTSRQIKKGLPKSANRLNQSMVMLVSASHSELAREEEEKAKRDT